MVRQSVGFTVWNGFGSASMLSDLRLGSHSFLAQHARNAILLEAELVLVNTEQTISRTREERFSGHESFVCRYGWLRKLYDAVSDEPLIFSDEEKAMVNLGIGKNMVRSIRFWGEAFGLLEGTPTHGYRPTGFGRCLLDEGVGIDPYLEDRASLWLLHWKITVCANLAAWNVAFHDMQDHVFTRRRFSELVQLRGRRTNKELVDTTIKQHTDIFFNTYTSADHGKDAQVPEDTLGCPLQELGLVKRSATETKEDVFMFDIGTKRGLEGKVFFYALLDHWGHVAPAGKTLPLKEIMFGTLSPGAVFKLSEDNVLRYLDEVEAVTDGFIQFVDSADVRSLHIRGGVDLDSIKVRLGFDESNS